MFKSYFSSIKEMQSQLFHVMAIAACTANMFGLLLNAFLHGNALPTQVCVVCGVVILLFSLLGVYTKHKGWATVGILITVVWIEFPFLYAVYNSVILVYFVLSIIGIVMFFPQKFSIPFCIITIIWDLAVIVLKHLFPIKSFEMEPVYLLIFTMCSYLIVAIAGFALLAVLIVRYEKQKEELCRKNEELDYMASHDPLTRLYNRGYLLGQIEKRIRENHNGFIAVIMDIDDFKQINDTYGHTFGDDVLITFAHLMENEIEGKGFAARFGGEEFMLIYDEDNQSVVLQSLHHLAEELERIYQSKHQIKITFSGGLERYSNRERLDELIGNADNKLYQAKRNGKNQIIC